MSYSIVIHSLAQARKMYGPEWGVIASAFDTILYLGGGCEYVAAEWLAKIINERPIINADKQYIQPQVSLFFKKLLRPQALSQDGLIKTLRTLEEDKCIVIPRDGDVYKDDAYKAITHQNWKIVEEQYKKEKMQKK